MQDRSPEKAMREWIEQARVGTVMVLPGGEAVQITRHGETLGVWSQSSRKWLYGGPYLYGRSLRAIRHWLAQQLGVDYHSSIPCARCGTAAAVDLIQGLDGGEVEEYETRCPVCGLVETWTMDERDIDGYIEAEVDRGLGFGEEAMLGVIGQVHELQQELEEEPSFSEVDRADTEDPWSGFAADEADPTDQDSYDLWSEPEQP